MANLNEKELRSLASVMNDILKDTDKVNKELDKIYEGQGKMSRKLEKDLKKAQVSNFKDLTKVRQEISKLNKEKKDGFKIDEKRLAILKKEEEELSSIDSTTRKVTSSNKEHTKANNLLTRSVESVVKKIQEHISVTGVLSLAITSVLSLYRNWADLQKKLTEAMGQASSQLGGTEAQMHSFERRMNAMRSTFAGLTGDVDGITVSAQHLVEVSLALRRNADSLGEGVENAMLRTARGFGIGNQSAGQLFRLLETGVAGSRAGLDDFGADMINFASDIGANASQLVSDFVNAQDAVAQFGTTGVETFRRAAAMANEFGFEARRIFDMMRNFDTFGQAAQNVNQLNAMFGTALSSFEVMSEQDPSRRLEMIRQAVFATGQDFEHMTRQQVQALAQATGQSEDIIAQVFGRNRSLSDIEREQRESEERRNRQENQRISNQQMMNGLLERTSTIFQTWDRYIQEIWNIASESLAPIFEAVHEEIGGLARQFRDWIRSTSSGQQFVRNIANWVHSMADAIRNVNWAQVWEDVQTTWQRWEPTVQTIGSMLMRLLNFAADHPGVVAAALGGAALFKTIGALSSLGSVLGGVTSGVSSLAGAAAPILPFAAGAAIPVAAVAGSYGLAQAAEQRRIEEGSRVRQGDTTTLMNLRRSGWENLRNRGDQFREGNSQEAFQGVRSSTWRDYREALGVTSGQEADQERNNIMSVIDDLIRSRGESPTTIERGLRRALPPEMIQQLVAREHASSLNDLITQRFRQVRGSGVTPANSASNASATQSAPVVSRTANSTPTAPVTSRTEETINVVVQADTREIGRAQVVRSLR